MKRAHPSADDDIVAQARALIDASAPAVADIETAIVAVERRAAEAETTIARLATDRPAILAAGSRGDLDAHDEGVAEATFDRDQAHELAARLKVTLVPAQEADRRAHAAADRAKAEALVTEAMAALADYPDAQKRILGILGIVAHADMAVASFAAAHPGEPPITSAEARIRRTPSAVSKGAPVRGWAWARENGELVDIDPSSSQQVMPAAHPANSALFVDGAPRPSGRGDGSTVPTPWSARNFLEEISRGDLPSHGSHFFQFSYGQRAYAVEVWRTPTVILPADRPTLLAEAVNLPALRIGEKGWRGHDGSPSEILAALAQPPADPRQPTRKNVLEQVIETGKLVSLPPRAEPSAPAAVPPPQPVREQEFALDARRLACAGATP